jgi:pimeloyl-ACP methyl ester carboxylesterase
MRTDAKPSLEGFDERWTAFQGSPVRYVASGSGPPLVLVHGLGGSSANWAELAPALARSRHVLALDLPGHGGSAPLPAAPTLAPFAGAVAAVLAQERVAPAPVVGHSLGGAVALRLALRHPEDVSGVVVVSGAGISSGTEHARRALMIVGMLKPGRRVARARGRIGRSDLLKSLAFSYWFTSDARALSPRSVEGFLVGHLHHSDIGSAWRALVRDDPRPDLHGVRCPALVVWGAGDRQLPLDDAFDYARRLRAPLRVIPDCGHLLIGERPDACLDAIESFLVVHRL